MLIIMMTFLIAVIAAQSLSLEEAREIAKRQNLEYRQKLSDYESALWNKRAALGGMLPSLSLSGTMILMDPATTVGNPPNSVTLNKDMRSISLNLSQPLFVGGKLWQAYKIAGISEDIAKQSLRSAELKLFAEVESKYLSALFMQNLLDLNEIQMNLSATMVELGEIKQKSGVISNADFMRLKAEQASKQVDYLQAETAFSLAMLDLQNYLKLDYRPVLEPIPVDIKDPLIRLLQSVDIGYTDLFIKKSIAYANKNNPAFKTLENSVELSKRAYQMSRGSFLPTLMLTGSRKYDENGIDRYEFNAQNQLLLTASLPILPQVTNYANTRKAYHQMRSAEYAVQSAGDGIELGIKAAALKLLSSAKQLHAASLALEYARSSHLLMRERFEANLLSVSDYLNVALMLQASENAFYNAQNNWLTGKSNLLQSLGSTDETILYNLVYRTWEE